MAVKDLKTLYAEILDHLSRERFAEEGQRNFLEESVLDRTILGSLIENTAKRAEHLLVTDKIWTVCSSAPRFAAELLFRIFFREENAEQAASVRDAFHALRATMALPDKIRSYFSNNIDDGWGLKWPPCQGPKKSEGLIRSKIKQSPFPFVSRKIPKESYRSANRNGAAPCCKT